VFTRIDHVGVIVDDLDEAKSFLEELGMSFKREFAAGDRLKGAFYSCGEADIEIIEIIEPQERAERLGGARAQIEHVGVEVDDLPTAMEALRGLGVAFKSEEPLVVGDTVNVWTTAESCDGIGYQLTQYTAPAERIG
jgi:methylmalonyl-CoA/ethylmalonyl-CoA epimerase